MAILEKIRNRSLFLILIIGLALFAFVISDLIGKGDFSALKSSSTIGEVNGETLSVEDFRLKAESTMQNLGPNASTTQAVNMVWEQEVRNTILAQEFEKIGLSIEKDKFINLVKN